MALLNAKLNGRVHLLAWNCVDKMIQCESGCMTQKHRMLSQWNDRLSVEIVIVHCWRRSLHPTFLSHHFRTNLFKHYPYLSDKMFYFFITRKHYCSRHWRNFLFRVRAVFTSNTHQMLLWLIWMCARFANVRNHECVYSIKSLTLWSTKWI